VITGTSNFECDAVGANEESVWLQLGSTLVVVPQGSAALVVSHHPRLSFLATLAYACCLLVGVGYRAAVNGVMLSENRLRHLRNASTLFFVLGAALLCAAFAYGFPAALASYVTFAGALTLSQVDDLPEMSAFLDRIRASLSDETAVEGFLGLTPAHAEDLRTILRNQDDPVGQALALGIRHVERDPNPTIQTSDEGNIREHNSLVAARVSDLARHGMVYVRGQSLAVSATGHEFMALPVALMISRMPPELRFTLSRAEAELARANPSQCQKLARETLERATDYIQRAIFCDNGFRAEMPGGPQSAGQLPHLLQGMISGGKPKARESLRSEFHKFFINKGPEQVTASRFVNIYMYAVDVVNAGNHKSNALTPSGEFAGALERAALGLSLARLVVAAATDMFGLSAGIGPRADDEADAGARGPSPHVAHSGGAS